MLMNEESKLSKDHYKIFGLSWAGWVFDFYDLVLFTFLVSQLQTDLHFSAEMLSLCLGISLFATGLGGIIFGAWAINTVVRKYCNGQSLFIQ